MRSAKRETRALLDALTVEEKALALDDLLARRTDLRKEVEAFATRLLNAATRGAVAEEVASALRSVPWEDIAGRSGRQPGRGYVEPGEAAAELLDEALSPFVDEIARLAGLRMSDAAREVGIGILGGLYECRGPHGHDTVLGWAEEFPPESAAWVLGKLRDAGFEVPDELIEELFPE